MSVAGRYFTVFQEPWWLEAAAPGEWDEVAVESGGQVVARLPFTIRKEGRLRTLTQPPLSQTLGPWIAPTKANGPRALSRENKLFEELINRLPTHDSFYQNFAPQLTNWLPFYWSGFSETTRYTYQIPLDRPLESILAGMDKKNRSQLRKASKHIIAGREEDLDVFLRLNRSTFARQDKEVPYSDAYVERLDNAVKRNASRTIIIARDAGDGRPLAGIYMVHYGDTTHSLMSGVDEAARAENPMIVARWESIRVASETSRVLDLHGSMMRGIERRNRNYGANQVPLMTVSRKGPRALRAAVLDQARQRVQRQVGRLAKLLP